ncbi:MAG: AAA family ATPase [Nitrospirota bacterium]
MNRQEILTTLDMKAFYSSELPSLKVNGAGMAQALCPLHNDTKPSLSINLTTGLYKCHGCNQSGDIFSFYQKRHTVNFKTALFELAKLAGLNPEPQKKIVKEYDYVDESGKILFQTVRDEPKDFKQRRHDDKGGWIYNLQGVRLVPYNLPEVIKADSIIIPEGERDADNLKALGLTSTCNPMGAGKWKEKYNQYFKGKKAIIIPDADKPGRDHALQIAKNLKGIAESVKIVELPDLKEKQDVSDWLHAGGTKERLLEIIKDTPEWEESNSPDIRDGQTDTYKIDPLSFLRKGSDLQSLECHIEWAIDKLLPKQSITLLHGKGGIGKTWLCLIMADFISKGNQFMNLITQKMPVVFIDFENSLPVLVDRVKKIGIEDVLFWHNSNEILRPSKLDKPEWEYYKSLPTGLLIFDTLRASQGQDENDSQKMAFIMTRLKELRDKGFTILLLHHTPKGNDRTYKGSTAILDLADQVLSLHKVKKSNPEGGEVDEDEDDHNCYYRLGTKDKTRYEHFHIFMSFDKEKGFIKATDPDDEYLRPIYEILKNRERLNQKQIFELIKVELDIKSKGKVINLLRKGEGKYWTSHRDKNAVFYEAIETVQVSTPIYRTDGHFPDGPSITVQTDNNTDTLQPLDNSQVSKCSAMSQAHRTDDRCSFCMLTPAQRILCEVINPCPKNGGDNNE